MTCGAKSAVTDHHPTVSMAVEHLAGFVFLHNVHDAVIELSMEGIRNNKDLFYFCLDLFCKGLVMLFGDDRNRVDLDGLDMVKFSVVRHKMLLAGIDTLLQVETKEPDPTSNVYLNLKDIELQRDDELLHKFRFKIHTRRTVYTISFDLRHVVD